MGSVVEPFYPLHNPNAEIDCTIVKFADASKASLKDLNQLCK